MTGNENFSAADVLYAGSARYPKYNKKETIAQGVIGDIPIYVSLGTPAVADADGVCASQSGTAATAMTIAGALASGGSVTFDTPRAVVGAWTGTAVLTVTGTDVYGEALVESSASGTSMTGKKAFKTVTSVVPSANITSATVGSADVLGLPFRVSSKNKVQVRFDGAEDGATIVAAVDTAATATTGDIRGTIDLSGTLNGSKEVSVILHGIDRSTKALAFGVAQFGG